MTLRSPSRARSTRSQLMTEETENMEGHVNDWKLGPNVQLKVVVKKLDFQNTKHFQTSSQMSKVKTKPRRNTPKSSVWKSPPNDKNFIEALRDLLPRCDPNCHHCEEYISKLSQHIQSAHEPQEDEQGLFNSTISNGQEMEVGTNFDLGIESSLALTQDTDSQSRTLIIRHTKVIHYVEEIDQNMLDQLPVTLEGHAASQNSTQFQLTDNCDAVVNFHSDQVQNLDNSADLKDNPASDSIVLTSTSIGDQDAGHEVEVGAEEYDDSDPDFIAGNETDSSEENEEFESLNEKSEKNEGKPENDNFEKGEENKNSERIVCSICEKTFSKARYLGRHMTRVHATEKPYSCETCNRNFASQGLLTEHKKQHKSGKKPHTCQTCWKCFENPEKLEVHSRTHTVVRPFKCDEHECGSCFKDKKGLRDHMYAHGEKLLSCKHCGKCFGRSSHLRRHMRSHNVKDVHTRENVKIRIQTLKKKVHTGEKRYDCEICGKKFPHPGRLTIHQRIHTGERPFKCNECHAKFKSNTALSDHKIWHTEKSHVCEHCGKAFHRKTDLQTHIRTHTGEKNKSKSHVCETCGMSYATPGLLVVHKRTHTGEKPFMCEICSACFNSSKALHGHMEYHKEKKHICNHCGYAFSKLSHLKNHVKIHTREKTYKCEDCEESFLLQKQFELHHKIHTGGKVYKCDCGKYFREMKQLTVHKKCHKDERKFKCYVCPKSFKLKTHLWTHSKIHSGIKPHKCDECGKTFTLPSELRSHQKRMSKCTPQARVCDIESVLSILE